MAELEVPSLHVPNVYLRMKPNDLCESNKPYELLNDQELQLNSTHEKKVFRFTQIIQENSSQEVVFAETTKRSLDFFLAGYDCLTLAYGTTNSGKTYTIQGNIEDAGLVPQSLKFIFEAIGNRLDPSPVQIPVTYKNTHLHHSENEVLRQCQLGGSLETSDIQELNTKETPMFSLWVSMIEVYNDVCIDIIGKDASKKRIEIRQCDGSFYPAGLTEINVNSREEALALIRNGWQKRKEGKTALNDKSSRSHCCVRLRLFRTSAKSSREGSDSSPLEKPVVSTFYFCDLAGIERIEKTGNTSKERLEETSKINKTMLVLGRCLQTLGHKNLEKIVVPYRENELTKILQPLFQVEGPKNVIINVNTSLDLIQETKHALNFSQMVTRVVLNPKHTQSTENSSAKGENFSLISKVAMLEHENQELKVKLQSLEEKEKLQKRQHISEKERLIKIVNEGFDEAKKLQDKIKKLKKKVLLQEAQLKLTGDWKSPKKPHSSEMITPKKGSETPPALI